MVAQREGESLHTTCPRAIICRIGHIAHRKGSGLPLQLRGAKNIIGVLRNLPGVDKIKGSRRSKSRGNVQRLDPLGLPGDNSTFCNEDFWISLGIQIGIRVLEDVHRQDIGAILMIGCLPRATADQSGVAEDLRDLSIHATVTIDSTDELRS